MTSTRRLASARLAIALTLAPATAVVLAPIADAATSHAARVIKVRDDGKTNHRHPSLHVGDSYVITYTECGACGYSWKVLAPANHAVIKGSSVSKPAPQRNGPTPIVGGPGTRVYTFKAKGAGKTSVKLGYFGPAMSKPSRAVTISFTVSR